MFKKVLFKYDIESDRLEYVDFAVKTGNDTVKILGSSGEILHNDVPVGGGGGGGGTPSTPYLATGNVIKCNIGVVGHPEENDQTIRVPLAPFLLDCGEGAPTGSSLFRPLTIEVVDTHDYEFIIPNVSIMYANGLSPISFDSFSCDTNTRLTGMSIGRKEIDPVTGKNLWRVSVNFGDVMEKFSADSLIVAITFDVCSSSIEVNGNLV